MDANHRMVFPWTDVREPKGEKVIEQKRGNSEHVNGIRSRLEEKCNCGPYSLLILLMLANSTFEQLQHQHH